MLILALFLLQAPPQLQAAEPSSEEIVVMGERLKRLRFSARVDKRGRVRCRVKRSSGDAKVDTIGCQAVEDCAARNLATVRAVQACMEERLKARYDALRVEDRAAH